MESRTARPHGERVGGALEDGRPAQGNLGLGRASRGVRRCQFCQRRNSHMIFPGFANLRAERARLGGAPERERP